MKRVGTLSGPAAAALGLLGLLLTAVACEEDGKTVPARCVPLPLFDIQSAGAPSDDNARYNVEKDENGNPLPPCITEVGHAVSSFGDGSAGEAPTSAGTGGSGGTSGSSPSGGTSGSGGASGGTVGSGGSPDAGAGGA